MTINTFLPMRNKFVYSCSMVKICASGFNKLLESIFCLPLVVKAFSLQKAVKMLKEVVAGCQELRWTWWVRRNFRHVQPSKRWLCHMRPAGVGTEMGPCCWPGPAAGGRVFGASHRFAEHASPLQWFRWDSESYTGSDRRRPPNCDHALSSVPACL